MKICTKCGESKHLDQFSLETRNSKPRAKCKQCVQQDSKEYRKKHSEEIRIKEFNRRKTRIVYQINYSLKKRDLPPSTDIFILKCRMTGKLFVSRKKSTRYSKEGRDIRAESPHHPKYRWPKSEHTCTECGSSFMGTPQAKYCSKECSKKHAKRISRMLEKVRERGCEAIIDRVDPIVVFERYDWHCAICTIETPRSLLGSIESDSPTLDHITPISAGGEHSYNNTQLLCRQCNMAKGAMIDPPKELVQLITINNQLNKKVYDTEQLVRST